VIPDFNYPLQWPEGQGRSLPSNRLRSQFKSGGRPITVREAVDRLAEEILRLDGVSRHRPRFAITSGLITNKDGSPRSSQRSPEDPGVAVYLQRWGDDYCFPCDRYRDVASNIAAIAAHIDALRGQERWGVGTAQQGMAGYRMALPDCTDRPWWQVLGVDEAAGWAEIQAAYRRKAMESHPDKAGEDDRWAEISRAYEIAKSRKPEGVF
jgi:hypothetical protein